MGQIENCESITEIHTLLSVKQLANGKLLLTVSSNCWSVRTERDGGEAQEGGNKCIAMADSC